MSYSPPTMEEFESALRGLRFEAKVPPGWKQRAIDVEAPGGLSVRVSTTIDVRSDSARGKDENAIDVVLVDRAGRVVMNREGRTIVAAKKVLRTPGWPNRLRERVNDLRKEANSSLRCPKCREPMVKDFGVPRCSVCSFEMVETCPACEASMRVREPTDGSRGFWGCTAFPACRKAKDWAPPASSPTTPTEPELVAGDEADEDVARAHEILTHPLLADLPAARKLLDALDREPAKVVPLVLGETTPAGKPTVEAILAKKIEDAGGRPKEPRRREKGRKKAEADGSPATPPFLDGIRVYGSADALHGPSLSTVRIPADGGPTAPAADYPHHALGHETLNPIQTAALEVHDRDCNVVVAASTSAGKTIVAEMFMGDALARGGKAIFLSPLKAVSQEKHDDWTARDHPWGKLGVSILTGDYTLTEARKKELRNADVIVMTSEMLDSRTRRMEAEGNLFLLSTLVLVVDEAHLLTMEDRGDALECGIMRFTRQNPRARVVLLSATMPNVAQLGEWLTRLNGKPTRVIESAWRPVLLDVHWPTYEAIGSYNNKEEAKRQAARSILKRHPGDKWIVFVHAKKAGYKILDELRSDGFSAEFHSADLDRDSRIALERRFRHGDLEVIVATSTLAWGINMPARRVLVLGVHRGMDQVDPIDVKQMVGRAGRAGWDEKGDAYVLLSMEPANPFKTHQLRKHYETIGEIRSRLVDVDTLAFHLTAEVAEGDVSTEAGATEWFARSLAALQGHTLGDDGMGPSAAQVMADLQRAGILKEKAGTYEPTMLGRVSSWLYFSPFDVADWCSNFRKLVELDRTKDDACLAWALGTIKTAFDNAWLPREMENAAADLSWALRDRGIERTNVTPTTLSAYCAIRGEEPKELMSMQRAFVHDSERIVQAVSLIDQHVLKGLGKPYCDLLGARLRYGCGWTEAELCQIPGIGAKRAKALVDEGVRSIEDVEEKKKAVLTALGKRWAIQTIRAARTIIERRKKEGARR